MGFDPDSSNVSCSCVLSAITTPSFPVFRCASFPQMVSATRAPLELIRLDFCFASALCRNL